MQAQFDSGSDEYELVEDESEDEFDIGEDEAPEPQREHNAFGDPVPTATEMTAMEEEGRLLLEQGLLSSEQTLAPSGPPTPVEYPSPRSSNYGGEDEEWEYFTNAHLTPRRSPQHSEPPPEEVPMTTFRVGEDTPIRER